MTLPRPVDALEEVRDPADAALGDRHLADPGSARRRRSAAGRRRAPSSSSPAACSGPSPGSRRPSPSNGPDVPMCMHSGRSRLLGDGEQRVPVAAVPARQAERRRVLGEADRLGAPARPSARPRPRRRRRPRAGGCTSGIWRSRVVAAPLVDHEVVVGPDAGQRELAVRALLQEPGAGEAGEGREAELRPDAVAVHVLDPGRRVVAAGEHLGERDRSRSRRRDPDRPWRGASASGRGCPRGSRPRARPTARTVATTTFGPASRNRCGSRSCHTRGCSMT